MTIRKDSSGRIFWGIIIMLVGVLLLLQQMDKLDFGDVIARYWPLILILVGVWQLIANGFRNTGGPLLLIALGVVFQLWKLDILGRKTWSYVWPLLIIFAGLWTLLGALRRRSPAATVIKEGDIDAFALFAGLERRVDSPAFRGGKATAIMGGVDLDLRGAGLAEGAAAIDLSVIMGGITLRVPRGWRVEMDARPLLGGIEDKHTYEPATQGGGTLRVKATAILGGIEIKD
jgi:predicted membrane protein